jgi:hypothetical protein
MTTSLHLAGSSRPSVSYHPTLDVTCMLTSARSPPLHGLPRHLLVAHPRPRLVAAAMAQRARRPRKGHPARARRAPRRTPGVGAPPARRAPAAHVRAAAAPPAHHGHDPVAARPTDTFLVPAHARTVPPRVRGLPVRASDLDATATAAHELERAAIAQRVQLRLTPQLRRAPLACGFFTVGVLPARGDDEPARPAVPPEPAPADAAHDARAGRRRRPHVAPVGPRRGGRARQGCGERERQLAVVRGLCEAEQAQAREERYAWACALRPCSTFTRCFSLYWYAR